MSKLSARRQPSSKPLLLNDVLVNWDPVGGPLSVGAALGGQKKKVLVSGNSQIASTILSGISLSGGYAFQWPADLPSSLASFACNYFKFDACAICRGDSVEILVNGRAPAPTFMNALGSVDLSSFSWDNSSERGWFSMSSKPYLDALTDFFSWAPLHGRSISLLDEGNSLESQLTIEFLKRLGADAVSASFATSDFLGFEGGRPFRMKDSQKINPWSAVLGYFGMIKNGVVAISMDAPANFEEEIEEEGGRAIRLGLELNDMSAGNEAFEAGVTSKGDWIFPSIHRWKENVGAMVAFAFAHNHEFKPLPSFSKEINASKVDVTKLGWPASSGWGWVAFRNEIDGYWATLQLRGETVVIKVEGNDRSGVKNELELLEDKIRVTAD
ncbi:MAG: hypothetical protein ACP5T2_02090 [Thermoprotei archaeon]